MKLRYWLLCGVCLLLVLAIPNLKTSTQLLSQLGNQGQSQTNGQSQAQQVPVVATPKTAQQIADEIFQRVNPAVVTVYCGREIGSGSIISPDGLVLTTKHVVWSATDVSVKTADGTKHTAWLVSVDPRYDLALVQFEPKEPVPTVTIANAVNVKPGDTVYAIGSPKGKAGTFTTGTFTKNSSNGSLQISKGLLEPGNSGGPLLNTDGEMIGVNKGLLKDDSGLATSVTATKAFIERSQRRGGRSKGVGGEG